LPGDITNEDGYTISAVYGSDNCGIKFPLVYKYVAAELGIGHMHYNKLFKNS
jgi:hypothetical protein